MRKILVIFILISFFAVNSCNANDDLSGGRICHESFEPIRRYEDQFQKTIEKNPKLFALILVSIFHKLPHREMVRMFEYVEEDLTFNKVDPRDAAKVFKHLFYNVFLNKLSEIETNLTSTKEELKKIKNKLAIETDKEAKQ